jgi:2-polyprenyl-3-methyl-5-hydroxy-6-metoxy-1,4-benzoquinol methylase
MREAAFNYWCDEIKHPPMMHRKVWEWTYILQALSLSGMTSPGRKGVGFGVGKEPLVSALALRGCEVIATDLDEARAIDQGWATTGQHATDAESLNIREICPKERFAKNVSYRTVDMNRIPSDLVDFDFVYSSCALEHLGSIKLGMQFVLNSLKCLAPGGIAVHTTEFNYTSNTDTIDNEATVLFRQADIETLAERIRQNSGELTLNFARGELPEDRHVDVPPYTSTHLRVQILQYATTSIGLIIRKLS